MISNNYQLKVKVILISGFILLSALILRLYNNQAEFYEYSIYAYITPIEYFLIMAILIIIILFVWVSSIHHPELSKGYILLVLLVGFVLYSLHVLRRYYFWIGEDDSVTHFAYAKFIYTYGSVWTPRREDTYLYYRTFHNNEAVDIILNHISPKVKHRNVHFVLAGKGMPKIAKSNVISVGFVPNLKDFLSSCDIAIVPLKRGEGTKLKIFDYIILGLPVVTTKKGLEGIEFLTEGKHVFVTKDVDDEFIKALSELIENPKLLKKTRKRLISVMRHVLKTSRENALKIIKKLGGMQK